MCDIWIHESGNMLISFTHWSLPCWSGILKILLELQHLGLYETENCRIWLLSRKNLYTRVYKMSKPLVRGSNGLYDNSDKALFPGLTWRGAFPLLAKALHVTKDEKLANDLVYLNRKVSTGLFLDIYIKYIYIYTVRSVFNNCGSPLMIRIFLYVSHCL